MLVSYVLYTKEEYFSQESVFNSHNDHLCNHDDPQDLRSHDAQHRFLRNVQRNFIDDMLNLRLCFTILFGISKVSYLSGTFSQAL